MFVLFCRLGVTLHGSGHGHSHGLGGGHGHSHSGKNNHGHSDQNEKPSSPEECSPEDSSNQSSETDAILKGTKSKLKKDLNVRAAFIHVLGDLVQSVGVFLAALMIYFKVYSNINITIETATLCSPVVYQFTFSCL